MLNLSAEHIGNLRKMAAYLRSGKLKADFDMTDVAEDYCLLDSCGSVGCVIGHGTFVLGARFHWESWSVYQERVFGVPCFSSANDWLFSASWKRSDNTPEGAAARIDWLLANGVPTDFMEQMYGDKPLCYSHLLTPLVNLDCPSCEAPPVQVKGAV